MHNTLSRASVESRCVCATIHIAGSLSRQTLLCAPFTSVVRVRIPLCKVSPRASKWISSDARLSVHSPHYIALAVVAPCPRATNTRMGWRVTWSGRLVYVAGASRQVGNAEQSRSCCLPPGYMTLAIPRACRCAAWRDSTAPPSPL